MLFARHPADVLLLEVGLGGRLDATNVIDNPLATIITRISIDHTDFLGGSVEKIAAEKAGILKRGVPAVIASQPRDALAVIERQAAKLGVPLKIAGEDWTATEERGRLVYQDETGLLDLPPPRLYGRHQFENAGLAIAALRTINQFTIPPAAYDVGMGKLADWPARRIGWDMVRLSISSREAANYGGPISLAHTHIVSGGRNCESIDGTQCSDCRPAFSELGTSRGATGAADPAIPFRPDEPGARVPRSRSNPPRQS